MQSEAHHPYEWTVPILALVLRGYGHAPLHSDDEAHRTILVACEHLQQAAHEHLQVLASLAPRISGAAALRLVLQALEDVTVPPRFDQAAIEMLGWLELPLDDAPALIVTGFNESYVPASQPGEIFLPEALRSHLGLPDKPGDSPGRLQPGHARGVPGALDAHRWQENAGERCPAAKPSVVCV